MARLKRDSGFVFFYRYYSMIKDFNLSDDERLQYYDHLISYGLFGRKPNKKTSPKVRNIFELLKQNMINANKNYEIKLKDKWDF